MSLPISAVSLLWGTICGHSTNWLYFLGTIDSLKNVKKDVKEMRKGSECGIGIAGFEEFLPGDLVKTYEEVSTKRHL